MINLKPCYARYLSGLKREIRDALEFILLPAIIALLPAATSLSLARWLAQQPWLYHRYIQGAWENAQRIADTYPSLPQTIWESQLRLIWLWGHVDFLWLQWRPNRLLTSPYFKISGQWPQQGGFIAVGLHWGSGFLVFPHLRQQGLEPYFIFRPNLHPQQGYLERFYRRWRAKVHQRLANGIMTGGAYARLQTALRHQGVPVILMDAPPEPGKNTRPLPVANHTYRVAQGFLRLIVDEKKTFVCFRAGINMQSGQRQLVISPSYQAATLAEAQHLLGHWFTESLKQQSSAWLLWPHSRFEPAQPLD